MASRPNLMRLLALAGSLSLIAAPRIACATQWSITPSINLMELYNDNFLLTPSPEPSVTGTVTTPRVDLAASQENWDLVGSAWWANSRYSGQSGLDTDDQYLSLTPAFKSERSTWQLSGTYAKESLLTSTSQIADIGLVHGQTQRISRTIAPTWTWMMSETNQIQLAYQRSQVTYGNGAAVGLFDYHQDLTSLTYINQYTERTQLFAILSYADFHVAQFSAPGTSLTSRTSTVQIGVARNFSETMQGNISAGARRTTTDQVRDVCIVPLGPFCLEAGNVALPRDTESGSVYSANLQKQFKRNSIGISLSRSIDPSGAGTQVQTDSGLMNFSWPLSERLGSTLQINAYRIRALGGTMAGVNRNYYNGGPVVKWQWTEQLTVSASYQYTWYKLLDPGSTAAASNAVFLTLQYTWPKYSVSR